MKAIEEQGKQWVKFNAFSEKESVPFDKEERSILLEKQKEVFYKLVAEGTGEIGKLHNSVNFDSLIYYFTCSTKDINFNY